MQRSHPQDGLVFSASSHFLQQNNSHVCSFIRDGRYCASPEFARGMGSCYVSTAYIFFRWASFSTNLLSQFSDNKHLFFKLSARYVTSSFTYFSDQGIPGPKPFPLVGKMWGIWKAVK
jgi:hypothetical protein